MHPIFYYILVFLAAGGIGMAVANRTAPQNVRRQRWTKYFMYILITGVVIISMFLHLFFWIAVVIVMASLAELVRVNRNASMRTMTAGTSYLIFFMVAAGFILFALTYDTPFLLFIYFQVLVFDGFCQVTGQILGKHPMAPAISPTKTWEGLAGGWICCIIAAILAAGWLPITGPVLFTGIIAGLCTGLVSASGDLFASWYKRKTRVKDYSNWLPGQGGFLDRFDSFLATGCVCYWVYIVIFKEQFGLFIK